MPTALEAALILAAFLTGGLVKGAIGLGLPVVVLAILAPVLGVADALALFLLPAIASNLWQATSGPHLGALAARLWPFLAAAAVGIALGVRVLAGTETRALEAMLGGLLVLYSVLSLTALRLPPPGPRERWMGPLAGGAGGLLFGMTGLFIVPGILYLETLGMRRDVFVQGLGLTFITISGSLAIAMGGNGLVGGTDLAVSAAAIGPTFAGLWAGRRLRHRISEAGFRRAFFIGLIGAGAFMIWRAGAV